MTVGDRIKKIRMARGMTQQELGEALGFSKTTANVRIAQYESGFRKPKKEVLDHMAAVLHVNPMAISEVNWDTYYGLMYTLFDLEETYGIHIDKIDGQYCLTVDPSSSSRSIRSSFSEWYKAWKNMKENPTDPHAQQAYLDWKLNYPHPINEKK